MKKISKISRYLEVIIAIVFVLISLIFGYNIFQKEGIGLEESPYADALVNKNNSSNSDNLANFNSSSDNLKVHFVDVGQGDAAIIELKGHYMLIDAGTNASESTLIEYINKLGIKKFDYVIGTHAHEDHIGGMDLVIKNYDIDRFLFSKHTTTTKTFENFVKELNNKNIKLYSPKVGETFEFMDSKFTVMAPNSLNYEEINNYSIVIKLTYKNNSILFTGDAETLSENEMLDNSDVDLKSDVIKIAHHGSSTSSSLKFLKAVDPKYAVISVAKGNDYNHPHKAVMLRLRALNIAVYRTDELSTIVMESDGENIKFDKNRASYSYVEN